MKYPARVYVVASCPGHRASELRFDDVVADEDGEKKEQRDEDVRPRRKANVMKRVERPTTVTMPPNWKPKLSQTLNSLTRPVASLAKTFDFSVKS